MTEPKYPVFTLSPFLEESLNEQEQAEFCKWAFGEDYRKLKGNRLRSAWNDRHRGLFPLSKFRQTSDEAVILIKFWKLFKEEKIRE